MNKKENRMAVRQAAQQAVIRDEQNHRCLLYTSDAADD